MTEQHVLSKAEILAGIEEVFEEPVKSLGGNTVRFRRLTSAEYAQIQSLQGKGVTMKRPPKMGDDGRPDMSTADMIIDIEKSSSGEREAANMAVAYGLSVRGGEQWTVSEVRSISPPSAVMEIARLIYQKSGVTNEQVAEMRRFRGERSGAGDSDPEPAGLSIGEPSAGPDGGAEAIPFVGITGG